ncbi:unnamed protein product [Lupinus luteus]|uniref:Uncharacterized protein n=1 Tax=Lupinus luteus TaxID=3873 RepID=A0AAV1WQ28_LUPLU
MGLEFMEGQCEPPTGKLNIALNFAKKRESSVSLILKVVWPASQCGPCRISTLRELRNINSTYVKSIAVIKVAHPTLGSS